ncbi:MAG: hypothetical protein V3U03_01340 [Myxococcota bacterium]
MKTAPLRPRTLALGTLAAVTLLSFGSALADYTVDASQPIVISDDIYDRTTDVESDQDAEE